MPVLHETYHAEVIAGLGSKADVDSWLCIRVLVSLKSIRRLIHEVDDDDDDDVLFRK
jgi:hypothetical protein